MGKLTEAIHATSTIDPEHIKSIILGIPRIKETFNHGMFDIVTAGDEQTAQVTIGDHRSDQWVLYKLRDRSTDGPGWQESHLSRWPNRHPDDVFTYGKAVEESKYFADPHHPLDERFTDEEARFIENPFEAIPFDNPTMENVKSWYDMMNQILRDPDAPYPGYHCAKSLGGLSKPVLERTIKHVKDFGYDYVTAVPTWFHVAQQYTGSLGFDYVHLQDKERVTEISDRLPQTTTRQKVVASWVVVSQFVHEVVEQQGGKAEEIVDPRIVLRRPDNGILAFPLTPERNLWVARKA